MRFGLCCSGHVRPTLSSRRRFGWERGVGLVERDFREAIFYGDFFLVKNKPSVILSNSGPLWFSLNWLLVGDIAASTDMRAQACSVHIWRHVCSLMGELEFEFERTISTNCTT